MSSSVSAQEKKLEEEVLDDAREGKWLKVFETYKQKRELRTADITGRGDTVLHMAVSSGEDMLVVEMVNFIVNEAKNLNAQNNEVAVTMKAVFGAKNEKGNTPLHLAASYKCRAYSDLNKSINKSIKMSTKIGEAYSDSMVERNKAGETPVFMAALNGNREVFLWLYYHSDSSSRDAHYKRNDNDTILHCAIAGRHIDVAIEIVHLYKDHINKMIKENKNFLRSKNGLYPLHILAATPSAFASTDLAGQSFIVKRIYKWFNVKEKEQATTEKAIFKQREREPCLGLTMTALLFLCALPCFDPRIPDWVSKIGMLIVYLLWGSAVLLLLPLIILESLFSLAGNWLLGIRKLKEKHTWSLQILDQLLHHPSCGDILEKPYEVDSEAGSKIVVDTPLIIAAKNGVEEMVKQILNSFPNMKNHENDEGKNIVLLAAEKRQTKLYQFLRDYLYLDDAAFSKVDEHGNTALHLAAKPGVNLSMQTTTMVEEFKWFEFVKRSLPFELLDKYNNEGRTAEEIFRENYKEHITSDREWLNLTSQTCSVASTLVASMAYSYIVSDKFDKDYSSLVALSLSLTSTISFLAILAFRSQSLSVWRYAPFMLQIAILTMFGSIVALWISLMLLGKSLTTYAILGSPIAILTIVSLPIFIGPTLMALFKKLPPPNGNTTSAIRYRRRQERENETASKQQN